MELEKENRYIVLKRSDISSMTLTDREKGDLESICVGVDSHRRITLGKPSLKCVVVESDWPEYNVVWDMIETRMRGEGCDKHDLLIKNATRTLPDEVEQALEALEISVQQHADGCECRSCLALTACQHLRNKGE